MSFVNKIKNLSNFPVILAPLAGVSDSAFRLMCQLGGADLTYVEMLSAKAIIYRNVNTLKMLKRHPLEKNVGVQITGNCAEDIGQAVDFINDFSFDTIDINMGCPVKKVVGTGCGSGILKNVDLVYAITKEAVSRSDVPVSVKIRLGWDVNSLNFLEVSEAIEKAGASWLTVHGRTRSQNYSFPVNLDAIKAIKEHVSIPVFGNGNIFSSQDVFHMTNKTAVDGVMVSRGALGNPWIFGEIKGYHNQTKLESWVQFLKQHLDYHKENYSDEKTAVLCFRKHFLWYLKGWYKAAPVKDMVTRAQTYNDLLDIITEYSTSLINKGFDVRVSSHEFSSDSDRFLWSSKAEIPEEDYKLSLPFFS